MEVELTRIGKNSLVLDAPLMPAAGTFGFGDRYKDLIKTEKFGAVVTDPISLRPRKRARGMNAMPLSGGVLLHTGHPNPGAEKVVKQYKQVWRRLGVPVIAHVIDSVPNDLRRCVRTLLDAPELAAFELGLHDQASADDVRVLVNTILDVSELPLLVRVPLHRAVELALVVAQTDAGAVVVAAPPRGMVRDPLSGKMVSGRVYGPLVKPQALHAVAQTIDAVEPFGLPVIGAGGIHTPQDARDYIELGVRAVQLDSIIWTRPQQAELIARDLGGLQLTRPADWYPDEWFPGIGETFKRQSTPPPPDDLPE